MENKSLIEKVLAYWIANDLLIPNDMPKPEKGIKPLKDQINNIKIYNYDKLKNLLPEKLNMSCNLSIPINQDASGLFASDEADIEAVKDLIYQKLNIDKNSDNESTYKIRDLYSISDTDYDICIGEVNTEKSYEYFYKTLNLSDDRIEKAYGTCCLFGLRVSREGVYIEESYNLSSFVWGIAKCCENKNIDWISQNSEEFENDKVVIDKKLVKYAEEHPEDMAGLLNLAAGETMELIGDISELVTLTGKAFINFYRDKEVFEKEEDKRVYKSELEKSFFLKDMRMLQKRDLSSSKLSDYISYTNIAKPHEINIKDDTKELSEQLHVKNFSLGKWPSRFNLSLMQQAAVNISKSYLSDHNPIFSVNGPPGTGKTTLLKEIIADRIVERAKLLSEYDKADDAFKKCFFDTPYDQFTTSYYIPDQKLIQYGILVASCNNAAVENITKELPVAKDVCSGKALTDLFDIEKCKNTLSYRVYNKGFEEKKDIFFTELANKLNGHSSRDKGSQCWGLVSAPLGKQSNIKEYYNNVLKDFVYRPKLSEDKKRKIFDDAKRLFEDQLKMVERMRKSFVKENDFICYRDDKQKEYDANIIKINNITDELNNLSQHLVSLKEIKRQYKESLNIVEKSINTCTEELQEYENRSNAFVRFIAKTFKTQSYNSYIKHQNRLQVLQEERQTLCDKLQENETEYWKIEQYQFNLYESQQELEKRNKEFEQLRNGLNKDGQYYTDQNKSKILDVMNCDIHDSSVQKENPFQNEDYDKAREALFFYALNLQKAFVISSDAVMCNIRLLSKMWGYLLKKDEERYIFSKGDKRRAMVHLFNTLFFVTPVISSTFASIQTLLKDVTEENSLGLLIVDEAGQASPHMMLGAYYRAQTAIVVGDPKQIEPVVTTPNPIRNSFGEEMNTYKPKTLSVQNFADNLNPYGTYLRDSLSDESDWVGCPLIVHRRCIDPMFGISNALSYDNMMINSTSEPDNGKFCINKSTWLDVKGKEIGNKNHFVEEQAEAVYDIIEKFNQQFSQLPNVYIITPFTSVKQGLIKKLGELNNHVIKGFDAFLENSIGTVHTFQGKDAHEVFFVLGCDENSTGAINWVKSNIVNVAVTRAKYRLCVVGDRELWTETNSDIFKGLSEQLDSDL